MGHAVGRKTNYFLFTVFRTSDPNKKSLSALYRMQMARSSALISYISRSNRYIILAQGIPSQIMDDEQFICLPQSSLFLQGMGRKVFSV